MQAIEELERQAGAEIESAQTTAQLREVDLRYLGKNGLLTGLMRQIGSLPPEEKPLFGQKVNEAKQRLQTLLEQRESGLKQGERAEQFERERIDITMPPRITRVGYEHVLQTTANKVKAVFSGLGFRYHEWPDLEEFKYNFAAL